MSRHCSYMPQIMGCHFQTKGVSGSVMSCFEMPCCTETRQEKYQGYSFWWEHLNDDDNSAVIVREQSLLLRPNVRVYV